MRSPLVTLQLGEPSVGPGLGAFGFPEDLAAELAGVVSNILQDIAAELTLGYRFDHIRG